MVAACFFQHFPKAPFCEQPFPGSDGNAGAPLYGRQRVEHSLAAQVLR